MNVIVVGGGKVGFYLAKTLIEHGHKPVIIERCKHTCTMLANQLDIPIILGDGSLIETLKSAQIEHADTLIAVTGKDEDNLITCQLAKKLFKVKRTVARVNNPKNAEVLKQLGVDIPVSSTDHIARLIEREIDTSAIRQLIALERGEASLSEMCIPHSFKHHGVKLSDLRLPEESVIVSITRDGNLIIPRGNTQVLSDDKIIIIAKNKVLHEIGRVFGLQEEL